MAATLFGYRYANRPPEHQPPPDALRFEYIPVSDEDDAGHSLWIINKTDYSLRPTLELQAVDQDHQPLLDVSITTVFGSDRGGLVVPPLGWLELLIFEGSSVDRVADVLVATARTDTVEYPAIEEPLHTLPLDAASLPADYPEQITSVSIRNPNPDSVVARLVYVIWEEPRSDGTERPLGAAPIGGLISVPAGGYAVVPVADEIRRLNRQSASSIVGELYAYPSN